MDFDQYVAARYGRLIEHAVLLGCAEGEAGTYVDQVLLEQRKRIRKAEDPDPLVHEALERAISGTPDPSSRTGPFVAIGLVAVAVAVGVALTYRPPPEPLPSLFALDATQAEELLEEQGYDVVLRPARACEPIGLVLGSEPTSGSPVREGETVTVRTAVPSDIFCEAQYTARSDAWEFVAFALGGPPPEFAPLVHVVVDRNFAATLTRADARDLEQWGATLRMVADAARATAPTKTGMPELVVRDGVPPPEYCGVNRPIQGGERRTLRIEIDPRRDGDDRGCPLTIDLYRSQRVIDSIVVYTPKDLHRRRPAANTPAAPSRSLRQPQWPGGGPSSGLTTSSGTTIGLSQAQVRTPRPPRPCQPRPEIGVHVAGLVVFLVAEDPHQHEDHAVDAEQTADDVADVECPGGVLLGAVRLGGVLSHLVLLRTPG